MHYWLRLNNLLKMEERLTKVWRILPKWVKEKGTKMCKIEVSSYLDFAPPLCLKVSKSRKQIMVSKLLPKNERKITIQIIF